MIKNSSSSINHWGKYLCGGVITALCLTVFFRQVNFTDLLDSCSNFQWSYLVLAIFSLAMGYILRIARWSILLRASSAKATFANCSAPFLASIALNNVLPLRLGDVLRALVFPKSMGISKTAATSSLIVERLIDLITLVASLAIGLYAIQVVVIPDKIKISALYLALLGGILLSLGFLYSGPLGKIFILFAKKQTNSIALKKICETSGELLLQFNMMSRPKLLGSMLCISMLIWIGEAGLFYFILLGTGIHGSPVVALLVMAVATLSTLVPSSPGYVGPFHLAAYTAISLVGGSDAQAGSYAIIAHLSVWAPTTIAGVVAIWLRPELFRATKAQTS
jgi:glycosyltransferase 2 family protein